MNQKTFSHYQLAKKIAQTHTLEELRNHQVDVKSLPGNPIVDEQFASLMEDAIIMKLIELKR